MTFHLVNELLEACKYGRPLPLTEAQKQRLQAEHLHLQTMLANGIPVYGSNRRPGHREIETASSAKSLEHDILKSHAIGEAPWYNSQEVRYIGLAKLAMWRAGGSGVSPALFDRLNMLLHAPDFQPRVPRGNSYSAGDVIPAAHWAQAVLAGTQETGIHTGQPEIMPLINGAFIHAGLALSALQPLRTAWVLFFENTVCMMPALRNNGFLRAATETTSPSASVALQALRNYTRPMPDRTGMQDPISLRATDQVIETVLEAIECMAQRLDHALQRSSCNPKIDLEQAHAVSQATFLLPGLTVAQAALVEALLFTMWAQVGRVTHLLSGEAPGIPLDAATVEQPLGLIQHPKQMMALLEEARTAAGRTVFSSGSSTSRGIEDLWSHGLTTTETLLATIERFGRMSGLEAHILQHLQCLSLLPASPTSDLFPLPPENVLTRPSQRLQALANRLNTDDHAPRYGFPVNC